MEETGILFRSGKLLSAMLNVCSYRLICYFLFFPELFVLFTFFFKLLHFLLLIF